MTAAHASLQRILDDAACGRRIEAADALRHLESAPLEALLASAEALTLSGFGTRVTYSRKVFIPLTQLCRDVCHYCTFAHAPRDLPAAYLSIERVLELARAGEAAGCKEALFTLGDKPELRYRAARAQLSAIGAASTIEYLERAAHAVLEHTGIAAAPESGRHGPRRSAAPASGGRLDGSDARVERPEIVRAGWAALWLAGQTARAAPVDAAHGG